MVVAVLAWIYIVDCPKEVDQIIRIHGETVFYTMYSDNLIDFLTGKWKEIVNCLFLSINL